MFNLEQAIADWRRKMIAGGINSAEVLDELEGHLRDDIEHQVHSGLALQQAFQTAVLRLGNSEALGREFAKSSQPVAQPRRRFSQAICFITALAVLGINAWLVAESELNPQERVIGFAIVLLSVAYMASVPFLNRWLSPAAYVRFVAAIKIASLFAALLPVWALLTAIGVLHFDLGLLGNMALWIVYTAVSITVFTHCLDVFRSRRGGNGGGPALLPVPRPAPRPPGLGIRIPPSASFAAEAREALELAHSEASRLGHDFIGTEHVLLGLLKTAHGAFASLLHRSNVDREIVRAEIERLVHPQPPNNSGTPPPLTPRARKALQLAGKEAKTSRQPSINPEHIFLGLLLENSGIASLALRNLGVRTDSIRAELRRTHAA